MVLAVAAVGSGLSLGWDSLAALGLTGVIVSLLPCLVMCAVGICASRMGGKNAGAGAAVAPPMEADSQPTAALAHAEASAVDAGQTNHDTFQPAERAT